MCKLKGGAIPSAPLPYLEATADDSTVRLKIHAQPNASRNQIVGLHGDALKIKIKAVPEDGKANTELIAFLAKTLGLPKRHFELISGQASRVKVVQIHGVTLAQLAAAIKV
ncbi:MAG: YggU family protein [Bdellovibrionales bacterium]|nr:YggU family protein [Bdellovibrionales bacterium]